MTDKEISKLNEGRTLRLAMPVLINLYERRKNSTIARLIGAYQVGEKLEPLVAELNVYSNLISELHRSNNEVENLENKIHK